jgi:hypothetical protein
MDRFLRQRDLLTMYFAYSWTVPHYRSCLVWFIDSEGTCPHRAWMRLEETRMAAHHFALSIGSISL